MRMALLLFVIVFQSTAFAFTPDQLWQSWPEGRFVRAPAPCLHPADLESELQRLAGLYPEDIRLEEAGRSFQGRPIHLMTLGHGPKTVLLWSQMHGNEPSATPALLDIADFLLSRSEEPGPAAILNHLTLLMIPMLNPDGAEIYQRRNFQGIDINRDARNLATPEGRILKKTRDIYQPMLGFNLHDQGRRTTVGTTGVPATIAVLAVSGDEAGTVTPGRARAKRACSAIVEAVAPFIAKGGVARFNEDWNPRAFGDNITAWGTPVVLLENGGLPAGRPLEELSRLNFVALMTVLSELARNDLMDFDAGVYDDLLRTKRNGLADVIVQNGFIKISGSALPFRADLAFNIDIGERAASGCVPITAIHSNILEIGDAGHLGANRTMDASDALIIEPFIVGIQGWSARRWIDAALLSDLARLGVGTVFWKVPGRKVEQAGALALAAGGIDRARLTVVSDSADLPGFIIPGPPKKPASQALADIINALGGDQKNQESSTSEALDQLLGSSVPPRLISPLRPGRPASFLLLQPAPEGLVNPQTTHLKSVFINGSEIP